MGKHERGYEDARPEKDLFPTSGWVTDALAEHINIAGKTVWECACGTGMMAEALRANGAEVLCSDVVDRGYDAFDGEFDFVNGGEPRAIPPFDGICTNPPFGSRNTLAEKFIEFGLGRLPPGGFLCLLLTADFDAAKSRLCWFRDNPIFVAKIMLTRRIVWFMRSDGTREAPKENHSGIAGRSRLSAERRHQS